MLQVGEPDLDAIGVFNPTHRSRLLRSVRTLREEGAASVYFTLEECPLPVVAAAAAAACSTEAAYEQGKAELAGTRLPRLQLKILLRERLLQDGVLLSCQPYSTTVS